MTAMVESAAERLGMPSGYVGLRQVGASHLEALEVFAHRWPIADYYVARKTGVCHEEFGEAVSKGVDTRQYASALEAGATHAEVIEAASILPPDEMLGYATARSLGSTHAEVIEAARSGVRPCTYAYARRSARHDEVMIAVSRMGVAFLRDYGGLRRAGATHEEVMDAWERKAWLVTYYGLRTCGLTHLQALKEMGAT